MRHGVSQQVQKQKEESIYEIICAAVSVSFIRCVHAIGVGNTANVAVIQCTFNSFGFTSADVFNTTARRCCYSFRACAHTFMQNGIQLLLYYTLFHIDRCKNYAHVSNSQLNGCVEATTAAHCCSGHIQISLSPATALQLKLFGCYENFR